MKIDTSKRIFGLDVMRATAILLVMFSHTSLLLFPETESTIVTIIRFFGAIGVDVFFVLSGFLIGGILLRLIQNGKTRRKDMLYFLVRRWLRTLPNYYLILIINILLIYFLHQNNIDGISSFFLFLQNFASGQVDFFTESWSLSIEEYAYIIGPAMLLLFFFLFKAVIKTRLFLWVTISIIVLITAFRVGFYLNENITDYSFWSHNLRKVVIYRIDSIYYGFIAAYISINWTNLWHKAKLKTAILGSVLFLGMHAIIFRMNLLPENASLFYTIFYLPLVSVSIALFLPWLSTWKDSNYLRMPITWISVLSYSLYLVNYSIVLLTMQKYVEVMSMPLISKIGIASLFWILSFILSYVLYRWYERPIINLRDKPLILNKFK